MNKIDLSSFNVNEFDIIVHTFYEGNNVERQKAQIVLTEFQKNPDSWQVIDQILEHSSSLQSKFIGLGILDAFVKVKWNLLPIEQRLVMRNYMVKLIIELTSNENTLRSNKVYINKLDQLLVQILKKDWPKDWPTFIEEMVNSSLSNLSLCENNMKILKYLSEEVFDFSNDFMTLSKKNKLKNQMISEFNPVFDLCKKVLANSTSVHLTTATLDALLKFIHWIPPQYLFQQDLIQILQSNFNQAKSQYQRNQCIQCFIELIQLETIGLNQPFLIELFLFLYQETNDIASNQDINSFYIDASHEEQSYLQWVTIFFTTFLTRFQSLVESVDGGPLMVHNTLITLLNLSRISEHELLKICLEFWSHLTKIFIETQSIGGYQDILQQLTYCLMENMVKPDDILLIENDEGEITRDFIKQSDTTTLSKTMKQVFQHLAQIQPEYLQSVIQERLKTIDINHWNSLFQLAWAVGYMSFSEENVFLEQVILGGLWPLLEQDQECVVASCLFYVVEQYPGFLRDHWEFSMRLFEKMFSYMQHVQSGVNEMACDAFLKISKCARLDPAFARLLVSPQSILEFALVNIEKLTLHLDTQQLYEFYEATSILISTVPDPSLQQQSVQMLLSIPNSTLNGIMSSLNSLKEVKTGSQIIRLNTVVCQSIGPNYRPQLDFLMPFLIQIYSIASQQISHKIQVDLYKRLRELILILIDTFVSSHETIQDQGLSDLIKVIVLDYKTSHHETAKEPHVLRFMTSLIDRLEESTWPELIKEVIELEYVISLPLMTSNFVDYPDLRVEFYKLLQILNKCCFMELFQSAELFQLNINSILWGTKHTTKEISDIALKTCLDLILSVSQMEDEDVSCQFFETYYVIILTDILEVLVDPDYRHGFKYQSQVVATLLGLVQEGEIYTRLFQPDQVPDPLMSNVDFLQHYVLDLLTTAFPLLQKDQIEVLVKGMFDYSDDLERFQDDLRDFLIDIREVGDKAEGEQRVEEEMAAELDLLRHL